MTCEEKVSSEDYRELFIDYTFAESDAETGMNDYCRVPVSEDIGIIYFRPEPGAGVDIGRYPYYALPKCYGLMQQEQGTGNRPFDTLALADAGILQVQSPPLSLTGRGVVIGLIDTGIRYTQDVFRNASGESRILAIWDQTRYDGAPPEGFLYGTEYRREQINQALQTDRPRELVPSWDEDGHGTAMASAAAGSSLTADGGQIFTGAAPDADIVVVRLREAKQYLREYYALPETAAAYAETDIVLAVKYLESFVADLKRSVVICLGIGTSYGSHTGSSVLDQYLDQTAAKRSRAIVSCGGNEGAAAHHFQGIVDTEAQSAELRVGEGERGFLLEVWAEGANRYQMMLRTPGGERITGITDRSRRTQEYRFVFDQTVVTVNSISLEETSGRSLLLFRFEQPTPGIWTFTIEAELLISGAAYNMWLPIGEFLQGDTYFLRPDPEITLTAPSMPQGVIAVTAYNDAGGGFYEKSGRGFTADRRIKPDFAAPGVDISTSLGKRTGTSMAAAVTAGAVAQLLQWSVVEKNYPLASGMEIKYYLALGAVRESGIRYPSREWGLGKINIQRTFQELAGLS